MPSVPTEPYWCADEGCLGALGLAQNIIRRETCSRQMQRSLHVVSDTLSNVVPPKYGKVSCRSWAFARSVQGGQKDDSCEAWAY